MDFWKTVFSHVSGMAEKTESACVTVINLQWSPPPTFFKISLVINCDTSYMGLYRYDFTIKNESA
jgi:hypothetical protein